MCEDQAEDFDLDSLLYDIVKFDPTKVVQQQQQTSSQQTVSATAANNQHGVSADMVDSGAPPTVAEQQSPQEGNNVYI